MFTVGIVGARDFSGLNLVNLAVGILPGDAVVLSGGARGVDSIAIQAAKGRGLNTIEYLPDLSGTLYRHEMTEAYYARNQKIVDASDIIIAFTDKTAGGTWDTIKRARRAGVRVEIIRSDEKFLFQKIAFGNFPRREYSGPYQSRRIGGLAVHRCRSMNPLEWAEFINEKDFYPKAAGARIANAFLRLLDSRKEIAFDAICLPPRSLRNIDKIHPVEICGEILSTKLSKPIIRPFGARDKPCRTRAVTACPVVLLAPVPPVEYLLTDDVSTTGATMVTATKCLIESGAKKVFGMVYVIL